MSRHEELSLPAKKVSSGNALELAVVATCGSGTCPTIYRTNRGTFLVQGHAVPNDEVNVDLGPGELLIEIPESLLDGLSRE